MKRTYRNVLDDAVRQHVPNEIDLFPRISVRLEKKSRAQALRARPAFVALAVLISLGLLSGVVYAVGRSLGYIPGVGIVEQGAALRILAEPVVVERDGITLTVTQGLAGPDKTVINYQVENIPESALARDPREGETPAPRCYPTDSLHLPDGTMLSPTSGQGGGWGVGFQSRVVFDALPVSVNEVTLVVSCLQDTSPGMAPENWQIPLTFVPAPPDLTVVPVVEITPSPSPSSELATAVNGASVASPITIERTIDLDDGYILIGSFHSIAAAEGVVTSPYVWSLRMTDAGGNEVGYDYASDIDLPEGDEHTSSWAYRISGKTHDWPLTITIDAMEATLPELRADFEFDTGPAPRPDQQWNIDEDLQIGDYTIRVLQATRTLHGYAFTFQAEPEVSGVGVDILGPGAYIPPAGGGGGGSGDGSLGAGIAYADAIPEGELTVVLRNVTIRVPGPWSIQWEPDDAASQAPPTASPDRAACVTDEVWPQVSASVSAQLPAGLSGKLILFGPNADESVHGVSVLDLADGSRRFLGEGSWPVISPDGEEIVFTADAGLAVYNFATDRSRILPGTDGTDYRMVWSPDSRQIAFIRSSTDQLLTIAADGSDQRQVRDNSAIYHGLAGWTDTTHLLITQPGPDGVYVQSLDLLDGSAENLFSMASNKADTVVSQDGGWIAFTNPLGGMQGSPGNGLYVTSLDGFDPRLVAALKGRALYFPIWSPDNRWLILSLPDPDHAIDQMRQALVELDTCRVIPMPDLGGEVYSWGR